jgi:hypothetical protein
VKVVLGCVTVVTGTMVVYTGLLGLLITDDEELKPEEEVEERGGFAGDGIRVVVEVVGIPSELLVVVIVVSVVGGSCANSSSDILSLDSQKKKRKLKLKNRK